MTELQEEIAQIIKKHKIKTDRLITIGTVESGTGGRISDKITNTPGSSEYFRGSIVAYSNDTKSRIVGVKETTLKKHGAVSPQVAGELASGGKRLLKVDICIADTGIAGPTGSTKGKPIGLFFIGLSFNNTTVTREYRLLGSREDIKQKATEAAIQLLKEYLNQFISGHLDTYPVIKHVVTCFLEHNNKILILHRSSKVGTYKRKWAGISGYIENGDLEQAFAEIAEETELYKNDITLIKKGEPVEITDKNMNLKWVVHPFLFHVNSPEKIKIDWEHTDVRWIVPRQLNRYETVPGLRQVLAQVLK